MGPDSLGPSNYSSDVAENAAENAILTTQKESAELKSQEKNAQDDANQASLSQENIDNITFGRETEKPLTPAKKEVRSERIKEVEESVLVRKDDAEGFAKSFSQNNREFRLTVELLKQLANHIGVGINEDLTSDQLIEFIRDRMKGIDGEDPDPVRVDKAFDFLIEFAKSQRDKSTHEPKERLSKIYNNLIDGKRKYNEYNGPAIQVGYKIIGAADAVATNTGEGIELALKDCRDIVHNAPGIPQLRKELETIGYEKTLQKFKGLSGYLTGNFVRPDLEHGELAQLFQAARKMQGILGVYRQAKVVLQTLENYVSLILQMDRKQYRAHINFETLAKLFFDLAEERYPAGEKIKQMAERMVSLVTKEPLANTYLQIAILNAERDMVKQVSPSQLFRSIQHRDDLYKAIIEALEDLEDRVEDLEEDIGEEKVQDDKKVEM